MNPQPTPAPTPAIPTQRPSTEPVKRLCGGVLAAAGVAFWASWVYYVVEDPMPDWTGVIFTVMFISSPLLALAAAVCWALPGRTRLPQVAFILHAPVAVTMFFKFFH